MSVVAEGDQLAVIGTDHTLASVTAPAGGAVYQLLLDVHEMQPDDAVTVRVRAPVRPAGVVRTAYEATFDDAQADARKDSPALYVAAGDTFVATLVQHHGTGRTFPYAIVRLR